MPIKRSPGRVARRPGRAAAARAAPLLLAGMLSAAGADADDTPRYQLRLAEPAAYRLQIPLAADPAPLTLSPALGVHQRRAAAAVDRAAREVAIDPALLHAVAQAESGYNAEARSPKGALGVLQLMPATAAEHGVANPLDPDENARGGARYLKALLAQFDGRTDLAVAAYNAGPGAVRRHDNRVPPYPETQRYVPAVMARYEATRSRPKSPYVAAYRQEAGGREPYRVRLPLTSLSLGTP